MPCCFLSSGAYASAATIVFLDMDGNRQAREPSPNFPVLGVSV
ncbi:hypothetical protein D805_0941 [Bifidobacterium thermophilum RBL67]|uniref:Uncharacterized protein n=1 Tax=Bifidobacterium thermophilum RBL67 TaxID=1254439 RepID=M4RF71_9BIFI|nr:hypothetical protein D805_0941 [Bifidobacterium thermophilum RBL67]